MEKENEVKARDRTGQCTEQCTGQHADRGTGESLTSHPFPAYPSTMFEDMNIVAWLSLRGHRIVPFKCSEDTGRIAWSVYGDIARDMADYHGNQIVGVQDYVRQLKIVRSSMFTLRELNGRAA